MLGKIIFKGELPDEIIKLYEDKKIIIAKDCILIRDDSETFNKVYEIMNNSPKIKECKKCEKLEDDFSGDITINKKDLLSIIERCMNIVDVKDLNNILYDNNLSEEIRNIIGNSILTADKTRAMGLHIKKGE